MARLLKFDADMNGANVPTGDVYVNQDQVLYAYRASNGPRTILVLTGGERLAVRDSLEDALAALASA
jgi:hypothetical protein